MSDSTFLFYPQPGDLLKCTATGNLALFLGQRSRALFKIWPQDMPGLTNTEHPDRPSSDLIALDLVTGRLKWVGTQLYGVSSFFWETS